MPFFSTNRGFVFPSPTVTFFSLVNFARILLVALLLLLQHSSLSTQELGSLLLCPPSLLFPLAQVVVPPLLKLSLGLFTGGCYHAQQFPSCNFQRLLLLVIAIGWLWLWAIRYCPHTHVHQSYIAIYQPKSTLFSACSRCFASIQCSLAMPRLLRMYARARMSYAPTPTQCSCPILAIYTPTWSSPSVNKVSVQVKSQMQALYITLSIIHLVDWLPTS